MATKWIVDTHSADNSGFVSSYEDTHYELPDIESTVAVVKGLMLANSHPDMEVTITIEKEVN